MARKASVICLLLVVAGSARGLENPSFEAADPLSGWRTVVMEEGRDPVIRADRSQRKEGKQSLFVEAKDPADIAIVQKVSLPANTLWRAVCWIRTEGLQAKDPTVIGGTLHVRALDNVPVAEGPGQFGTSEWREVKVPFRVPASGEVNVVLFFVGFGKGTGKAWFDGVRLEEIKPGASGPVAITGPKARGVELIDAVMLKYREKIGCTAATLAISRWGSLLYSRGYGWRDREWTLATEPDTMMGIASCDKPLASAAIHRLARKWPRQLDAKLFDILPVKPQGPVVDPRVWNITIRNVLEHAAGWGGNPSPRDWTTADAQKAGFDGPIDIEVLLGFAMTRKLNNAPGAKSEYCNFGYDILRHIVEKESGKTFAEYCIAELLGYPAMRGLHDAGLPVRKGDPPLVWNDHPDSGEVSASAPAMCRFMERYWLTGEPRTGGSAIWFMYGSLPNTTALMIWRADGVNIAAVFNGRGAPSADEINQELQRAFEQIARK